MKSWIVRVANGESDLIEAGEQENSKIVRKFLLRLGIRKPLCMPQVLNQASKVS